MIKQQSNWLFFLLLFLLSATALFSQEIEYTVKGRVIDENEKPKPKVTIWVSPVKDYMEEGTFTDANGLFFLTQKHKKGVTWYLYTIDSSSYSKNKWELIYSRFFNIGQPIEFSDKPIIDVGDVKVRMWYVDVNLRLQKNGKNLTEKDWLSLWVRLKDERGKVLAESSIAPTIGNEVDLEKSLLKLSLPEGKWKFEFQRFDYSKVKVNPKIIGQTPYLGINKERKTETIDVSLSK